MALSIQYSKARFTTYSTPKMSWILQLLILDYAKRTNMIINVINPTGKLNNPQKIELVDETKLQEPNYFNNLDLINKK